MLAHRVAQFLKWEQSGSNWCEIGSTSFHSVNDLQLVEVDRILVENLVLCVLLQISSEVLNDFDRLIKTLKEDMDLEESYLSVVGKRFC